MRQRALAILPISVMFATLPAFAQMTQQNRQNQGNSANPPLTSAKQGNASTTGVTSGPAAGMSTAPNTAVPKQSGSAAATGVGAPGTPAKPGAEAGPAQQKPASQ